jgi:hypothetical protein
LIEVREKEKREGERSAEKHREPLFLLGGKSMSLVGDVSARGQIDISARGQIVVSEYDF